MSSNELITTIETQTGRITLSPSIIRKYLVHGQGAVTDQEIMMFLALCKHQRLNPFLREAYLIKYGNAPATIVVGKEAYLKRARSIQDCQGYAAGVVCKKGDSGITRTNGICPPGHELIGGWAMVFIKGWDRPVEVEVSLNEYIGRTKDGTPTTMWREKPATMIRKVALVQALREAFPFEFGGMISEEEAGLDAPDITGADEEKPGKKRKKAKATKANTEDSSEDKKTSSKITCHIENKEVDPGKYCKAGKCEFRNKEGWCPAVDPAPEIDLMGGEAA